MLRCNHFLNVVHAIEREGGVFAGILPEGAPQIQPSQHQRIQAYVVVRARTWLSAAALEIQQFDKDFVHYFNETLTNFWCVANQVELGTVSKPHSSADSLISRDVFHNIHQVVSYENMLVKYVFKPAFVNYEHSRQLHMNCISEGNKTLQILRTIRLQHSSVSKSPLPSFENANTSLQQIRARWGKRSAGPKGEGVKEKEFKEGEEWKGKEEEKEEEEEEEEEEEKREGKEREGEQLGELYDPSNELKMFDCESIKKGLTLISLLFRDHGSFGSGRHIIPLFHFWQQLFSAVNGCLTDRELKDLTVIGSLDRLVEVNVLSNSEGRRLKDLWHQLINRHYSELTQHVLRLVQDQNAARLNCGEQPLLPEILHPVDTRLMSVLNLGEDDVSHGIFSDLVENWTLTFLAAVVGGTPTDARWNPRSLYCDSAAPKMTISAVGSLWEKR